MNKLIVILKVVVSFEVCLLCVHGFSVDLRDGLILSPMIEAGEFEAAGVAAEVQPLAGNVKSYAGLLTVDKRYNSNMFFWFFPSEKDHLNTPVVVWLSGGPGASSLLGQFCENGPFYFENERNLTTRPFYWSQHLNVIYIDNPVGTGFSFTRSKRGYAKSQKQVGRNLYSAVRQFFQLFPEYSENDFFVSGSSYAGKYVPTLAFTIHQNNQRYMQKINLKGLAIGNGFSDPKTATGYGEYLYQIGLLDHLEKEEIDRLDQEKTLAIEQERYLEALEIGNKMLKTIEKNTGLKQTFNYLSTDPTCDAWVKFLSKDATKQILHTNNLTFHNGSLVKRYMSNDMMQTVKPAVEFLIEKYRILFYSGQLDIMVPFQTTRNFLNSLSWSGATEFHNKRKTFWEVNGELAGYIKTASRLTEVLVRNAGHNAATNKPEWVLDLITKFTQDNLF